MLRKIIFYFTSFLVLCALSFCGANILERNALAMPAQYHILYGNVYVGGVKLTKNDDGFRIFMRLESLNNQIIDSFTMGDMGDQYRLIVPTSIFKREPKTAQKGDSATIFIDADDNPDNGNEVPIIEAYMQPGNRPVQMPYIIGKPGAYLMMDIHLERPKLIYAAYDVVKTTLILQFDRPVLNKNICFDSIGMEANDSGKWDFALSSHPETDLHANEKAPSSKITIDINRNHATTINMILTALFEHLPVDLLLLEDAFTPALGAEILGSSVTPVTGLDNIRIQIIADGFYLGKVGDVDGNNKVSTYDAALILRSTVKGPTVFPVYQAALRVNKILEDSGCEHDIMTYIADADQDGKISEDDAKLVLQWAVELSWDKLAACPTDSISLKVSQNYPNPFNPDTWIPYQISETANLNLTIYDINGQIIKQLNLGNKTPGYYTDPTRAAYWDGRNEAGEEAASGVYFYYLQANRDNVTLQSAVGKMMMTK